MFSWPLARVKVRDKGGGCFGEVKMHHDGIDVAGGYMVICGPADVTVEGCLVVIVIWRLLTSEAIVKSSTCFQTCGVSLECIDYDDKEGESSHFCVPRHATCNR